MKRHILSSILLVTLVLLAPPLIQGKDHYFGTGGEWGKLKTKVKPANAAVYVDGQYVGHADQFNGPWQELFLNPGEHEITFTVVYFQDYSTRVSIQANQTAVIERQLEPSGEQLPEPPLGIVKFRCDPMCKGAVLVNGRFIGHADEMNGPMQRMVIEPGTYKIELLQAGYQPVETTVTVEANQTSVVEAKIVSDGSGIYTQK